MQRVQQAVARLKYRPNPIAQGLNGSRTRSIGAIWAFADPWTSDATIALEVLEHLQGEGYATYQAQSSRDNAVVLRQLADFDSRRVDAVLLAAEPEQLQDPEVVQALGRQRGVVVCCREDVPELEADIVIHDRRPAIDEVVDHLVATGRRRIAMATSLEEPTNPPKFDQFRSRLRKHGIDHDRALLSLAFPDAPQTTGQRHRDALCRQYPADIPLDAIFAFNDIGALFLMAELKARGLRVPHDLAVVGFNNIEPGQVSDPPLATGDRARGAAAEALGHLLSTRLGDPDAPHRRVRIPMKFVPRESAAAARSARL
jgi:LacI family transcriptional regulator